MASAPRDRRLICVSKGPSADTAKALALLEMRATKTQSLLV
jgi:hypothetical protein